MIVIPLASTSVNWKAFDQVIFEVTGVHPNTFIDNAGIGKDSPIALAACCDLVDNQNLAIDLGYVVYLVAGIRVEDSLKIISDTTLTCRSVNNREETWFYFAGTLRQWRDSVIQGTAVGRHLVVKTFYGKVMENLIQAGCKRLFGSNNGNTVFRLGQP